MHDGGGSGREAVSGDLKLTSVELDLYSFGSVSQGIHGVDDGKMVAGGMKSSPRLGEGTELSLVVEDTCMDSIDAVVKSSAVVCDGSVEIDACMESSDSVDACMDRPLADQCCMGSGLAQDVGLTPPLVFESCPQPVCFNANAKLPQQKSILSCPGASRMSDYPRGNAWEKPKAIPMPSLESLGRFSDDEGNVILDEDEVNTTVEKFNNALVGRLFGRKIPYLQLSIELKRRWEAFGVFRLITLSGDCFLCIFDCAEACEAVLLGGPWVLFGQVLGVDRWNSSFSPSSLEGFKTPVWVRMPGLPLYCWSSKNIARMCASIGEPLWLDSATERIERGLFARACIRLDLSKPLKPGFWVVGRHGRFFQPLEYEGLPLFCFRCRQVGHKEFSCKVPAAVKISGTVPHLSPTGCGGMHQATNGLDEHGGPSLNVNKVPAAVNKVPAAVLEDAPQRVAPSLNVAECDGLQEVGKQLEDRGAGPWMIVARRRRSNIGVGAGKYCDHSKISASPSAKNIKPFSNSKITPGLVAVGRQCSISKSQLPLASPSRSGRSCGSPSGVWQAGRVQHSNVMDVASPMVENQGDSPIKLCWNGNKQDFEERGVLDQAGFGKQQNVEGQQAFMEFSAMPKGQAALAVGAQGRSTRTINAQLARASRSFKERIVSELGPVYHGSRKRRKAHSFNDGGDASPSPPP